MLSVLLSKKLVILNLYSTAKIMQLLPFRGIMPSVQVDAPDIANITFDAVTKSLSKGQEVMIVLEGIEVQGLASVETICC